MSSAIPPNDYNSHRRCDRAQDVAGSSPGSLHRQRKGKGCESRRGEERRRFPQPEALANPGGKLPRVARAPYSLHMPDSVELIGRERERRLLDNRLDRAAAGEGGLLLLAGEAGVGKTSLAEAALGACALLVLRGAGSEQGRTPYAPVIAALRAYDRIAPAPSGSRAASRLISRCSSPSSARRPAIVDPLALAEALRGAFTGIAGRQPAAVFLDDLQWADEATLELLPSLAASVEGRPLLFLALYRSDEATRDASAASHARRASPRRAARGAAVGAARSGAGRRAGLTRRWAEVGSAARTEHLRADGGRAVLGRGVRGRARRRMGGSRSRANALELPAGQAVPCRPPSGRRCCFAPTGSRGRRARARGGRRRGSAGSISGSSLLSPERRVSRRRSSSVSWSRSTRASQPSVTPSCAKRYTRRSRGRGGVCSTAGSRRASSERARRRSWSPSTGSRRASPSGRARSCSPPPRRSVPSTPTATPRVSAGARSSSGPQGEDEAARLVALERLGLCAELSGRAGRGGARLGGGRGRAPGRWRERGARRGRAAPRHRLRARRRLGAARSPRARGRPTRSPLAASPQRRRPSA